MMASTASRGAVSGTIGTGRAWAVVMLFVPDQNPQQVLDMDDADDVVEISFVDRVARVRRRGRESPARRRACADRDAGDPDARHHHFARGQAAELEEFLQHLAGLRAQRPEILALLNDQLQFFRRVVLVRRLCACR